MLSEEGRKRISEANKGKPKSISARWKAYKTKTGNKISLSDYKDHLAKKKGEFPPSKLGVSVFHAPSATEYKDALEASKVTGLSYTHIISICESKSGDFIFLKDL